MITLYVSGTPAPKGSARAIRQGAFARLVASSSDTNKRAQAAWAKAVVASVGPDVARETGAIAVSICFRLARPNGHWGTGRNARQLKPGAPTHPVVKPDIDKLTRCTLDALSGLAYDDDSQVIWLQVTKIYAVHEGTGAEIRVWSLDTAQQEAA